MTRPVVSSDAMDRFREVFDSRRVILPVVRVTSAAQALKNARIAREAGADGAFLISEALDDERLLEVHAEVAEALAPWWLGVNCLGLTPREVCARASGAVAGVWVDDALIDEDREEDDQRAAREVQEVRGERGWQGLYFGGVAFKYKQPARDPARAARLAAAYMDVVTTSGTATGTPPELEKVRRMKRAVGEAPLALASGISPENVAPYLELADCFLVATSIRADDEDFDECRTAALVRRVHEQA